ncbi:CBS domain-containing protein [Parafilimonas sp.]|uniref:CBS domain-containing protein n=1 Tax=Parafilimonas sp. TaxID=1969739 RepID=UPI0039E24F1D
MKTAHEIIWQKKAPDNFIDADALVIEALNELNKVNLSYLIVKDKDDVTGIFSERDYARKVALQGRSSRETKVKEVMSTDLPEVQGNDSVQHCMNLLAEHGRRYIIVRDQGKFEGVITIHDLLREVLLHGERVLDVRITSTLIEINERPPRVY